MTVAVTMSKNEQETNKATKTGGNGRKQEKLIRDVRSGAW
jgi:hypothetical protein